MQQRDRLQAHADVRRRKQRIFGGVITLRADMPSNSTPSGYQVRSMLVIAMRVPVLSSAPCMIFRKHTIEMPGNAR